MSGEEVCRSAENEDECREPVQLTLTPDEGSELPHKAHLFGAGRRQSRELERLFRQLRIFVVRFLPMVLHVGNSAWRSNTTSLLSRPPE